MPPQTLAKIRFSGNYVFGNQVLTNNPSSGALVARAIAGWAITEAHLGNVFAALLGAKQPVTMNMYAAFRSFEVQRRLLETAAQDLLPKRYAAMVLAVLVVLNRRANDRHKLAHWIWGAPVSDPHLADSLFLTEPRHFWRMRVARIRKFNRRWNTRKGYFGNVLSGLAETAIKPEEIYVYKPENLKEICDAMERSFNVAQLLYRLIETKGAQRRQIYSLLNNESEIHLALQQQKKQRRADARKARRGPSQPDEP